MREIKKISYSYIHQFACPYAAFLRYEAAFKLKTTDHLALGNALHKALEDGHRKEWNLEAVLRDFLQEFNRIIKDDDVFISYPKLKKFEAEGVEMLELYDYGIKTGRYETPTVVEKAFELPFEDEIIVVGKIDAIKEGPAGYTVKDYKSSKYEPDPWFIRHDLQFTTYAWACFELYGELPSKLIWHHLRNGKEIETTRTFTDIEELKTMLRNAIKMNKDGIRYRVYHSQICNYCDFKGDTCDDRELEKRLVEQRDSLVNGDVSRD